LQSKNFGGQIMPYFIAKDREGCKGGWAVVDETGDILGCHPNKQSAIDQAVAVSISTDEPFEGERAALNELVAGDYVTWVAGDEVYFGEVYQVDGDSAEVKIYDEENGIYVESVLLAIVPVSDLTKIANLPTVEPMVETDPETEMPMGNRWSAVAESLIARIEAEQERETMTANTRSKWVDVAWRIKSQLEGGDSEGRSTSKQEQRIHATDFEIRETADGMSFTGYAAVFNSDSEPLPFIERIAPGAFKRSLQSRNEVKLLWNHDAGEPLASVRGGTLRLVEDEIGLRVEATLANTTRGRDVAELIRSKTIDSMSFGFSVIKDSWQGEVRTLEAVRLFETSVVSWPAYTATSGTISVRSAAPGIDADQLADALMRLESGEELEESHATLITDVVAKLTKTEEVQEVQGDILALKKKKLDLLLKEM
jgi:HK97 family phage prohead protease